ncbi:MAG: hypothetical protein ABSE07_06325 [Methanoregula sp.]|jgi:hypothetical protein
MSEIAVRGYTKKVKPDCDSNWSKRPDPPFRHDRVLVFDTETTIDEFQNLKIGYFQIQQKGILQHNGLIYDPLMRDKKEIEIIKLYAETNHIPLYSNEEFIENVFYPGVYDLGTLCVGFNLAFDISRISYKSGDSRRKNSGGFTLYLSKNPFNPPIIIKRLGQANSFKFTSTKQNCKEDYFSGHFIDVQTLAKVLLRLEHPSLKETCKILKTRHQKMEDVEHGRVTERYIDYLIMDVEATYEAYCVLTEELDSYQIEVPITKIYSDASLGKYFLKQFGIKSFFECQPNFPPSLLGIIMTAYFGGRTECMIRKTPVRVTVLDFTSMYPSISSLLGLERFIKADSIEIQDATEEIRNLLPKVNTAFLQNPDVWKDFVVLVKVQPEGDIFPVRKDYKGDKKSFNVGINQLTSKKEFWYSLPDVLASILLTGKPPRVIEAIRFVPMEHQTNIKTSVVLGTSIDPKKDNLTQFLVEERQRIKQKLKDIKSEDPEYARSTSRERALKILVNAMSYGIFIELNPDDTKSILDIFGLENFSTDENRYEKPGPYFHPLLAAMITSGARLFLAMAEAKLREWGYHHAYMDTDSIFVPPECAQPLSDFFQCLNPNGENVPLLKIEPEKESVWFYGISSKRYALYQYENGIITLIDYKLHGLGHLTNPFPNLIEDWHKEIWIDILRLHYGKISELDLEMKYANLYAISKMSISTSNILRRFKKLNQGKDWKHLIKPFNFFCVGFQTMKENGKMVKPIAPYSKDPQTIVHLPFIDYETGVGKHGSHYFKTLSRTVMNYIDHPEYKYEGDTGLLKRKHVHADDVIHIGKEANNIDLQPLKKINAQIFLDKRSICQKILSIRQCDAEKAGVDRKTFQRMKGRIRKNNHINLKTKAARRLVNMTC